MTAKEFLNAVANGEIDVIQTVLGILSSTASDYCVIGGLAVNAYAEPVVSLDLDIVVVGRRTDEVSERAGGLGFRVERFPHSVNLSTPHSDLRVQLQTDERYQPFIPRARIANVLGYEMRVAAIEDVLQGKVWAYEDETRRKSKRQKDLADIIRLVESEPDLAETLPAAIRQAAT